MDRVTRQIGNSIEFVDGKGYAALSPQESMKLLLTTLFNCENQLEDRNARVMTAYFNSENWLYGEAKDKPIEIKSAICWGALSLAYNMGAIDWNTMRELYGEYMSKAMDLR